ncbi:MAG: mechanosensitive ion channel domain-containing protein [Gemmatimonadaceae bacterium]
MVQNSAQAWIRVLRCVAALALFGVRPSAAQTSARRALGGDSGSVSRAASQANAGAPVGAPVVFEGDTLLRLYGQLGPFSAAARAAAVSERLRQVRARIGSGRDSIVVIDRGTYTELTAGDVVVMTVLDEDARAMLRPRNDIAAAYAVSLRRELVAATERVGSRAIVLGAAYALASTAALVLLLWLLSWTCGRLYARVDSVRSARLPAVRIQQFEVLSPSRITNLLTMLVRLARLTVTVLLFYIYVPLLLSFFPWTVALSRQIVGYAMTPFAAAWDAFIAYVPNVFYIAVIALITRWALKGIHAIFDALAGGGLTVEGFHRDWADPTYKILRVLILAFAAVVLFPYLPGARSDAFKGVSLFLGVLLSFGSSTAIGNVVAGVVLTYTRAFQLGDRVQIGETVGDVMEKTLLVTRLRTIKNVEITIPNGMVLSSHVVNYSSLAGKNGLILHTSVTIGYDAPWRQVHALLIEAATRTADISAEPSPFVLQTSLDDFYVTYEVNAYTAYAERMALIYSRLHENIQETFNGAGVEIMSPHYAALRDGNETSIPPAHRARDYQAASFRVDPSSR